MKQQIIDSIIKTIKALKLLVVDFAVEYPADMAHGDYSTNVAMVAKQGNPRELAETIVAKLGEYLPEKMVSQISVAGPGFINISIRKDYVVSQVDKLLSDKVLRGSKWGKKIVLEYAHPNTHKQFHIGHLRNISLGESIARLLEAVGTKVIRVNYQGDVGLHIAKAIWGILNDTEGYKKAQKDDVLKRVEYLGGAYAKGAQAYEKNEANKKQIQDYNRQIFEGKGEIINLWEETRQWSLDYFAKIYQRVGTKYDRLYFESECRDGGEIAKKAMEKGILKKSQGAIVFDGSKYGLDTRVFVNSLGLPTYEAKELSLAPKEFSEFGVIDRCIHVVGPEQKSFFEVTIKVEELLNPKLFAGKQHHRVYAFVNLKKGKMSSRLGQVVTGWWLLEEAKAKIKKDYKVNDKKAEDIAIAAVKYAFLKVAPMSEISFDFEESIKMEGNSGPYLQYTYARAMSVLAKADKGKILSPSKLPNLDNSEDVLLRTLPRFAGVVSQAAEELSPNLLANFLFDVAQKFNSFYNSETILKAEGDVKQFRLWLTKATAEMIKKGLYLLGIATVEKM